MMVGIKFLSRDDLTRFTVIMSFHEIDKLFIRLVRRFGWARRSLMRLYVGAPHSVSNTVVGPGIGGEHDR